MREKTHMLFRKTNIYYFKWVTFIQFVILIEPIPNINP